jgi:hypothetical protein|tara:strand:+ start:109 stop:396 length:288 start_codon:yes stop_codon:yes gene_type:complete
MPSQAEERAAYLTGKLRSIKTAVEMPTITPSSGNNVQDLGTPENRYANIYCNDLNLANDRGDWTLIEEEDYLSLRNNKNGKIYKIVMEEVTGATG